MAKQPEIIVNNFSGGMGNEMRAYTKADEAKFWYSENLDVGENNFSVKQVLNNQVENTGFTQSFNILKEIQVGTVLYGIGRNGSGYTTIYSKQLIGGTWTALTTSTVTSSNLVLYDPFFVSDGTYIYYTTGTGTNIARYTIASPALNATYSDAGVTMFGGVIGADGNMYGYSGQSVYKLVATTSVAAGPSIPSTQTIVQTVSMGTYLAIICTSSLEKSKMFLWDYVDTVYFVDKADIGFGTVTGGELVDGTLYVLITNLNSRGFKIKTYSTSLFTTVYTYTGRYSRLNSFNYSIIASRPRNNQGFLYFIVAIARPDSTNANIYEYCIARYGRKDTTRTNTFSIYKTLDFTSGPSGVSTVGNDLMVVEDSSLNTITVNAFIYDTINTSSFFESTPATFTSQVGVLETFIFAGGDPSYDKKLGAVSMHYKPMPAGATATLKYKANSDTTWTTICVDTANTGSISKEAVTIESTGLQLPDFKEIQFRVELTGGVEFTGMKARFTYETNIYG